MSEILNALQSCQGELSAPAFFQKLSELHFSKLGRCNLKQLLDDMVRTRGLLEVNQQQYDLPSQWIGHLYDAMIAMGSLSALLKRRDQGVIVSQQQDQELIQALKQKLETFWNQMLETM